jgi:hypothetical protein
MAAYSNAAWSDFALGQVGASAALLGLVFVGLSINLRAVVREPPLVSRAAEAVVLLGTVLATSTAVLLPGQTRLALAIELVVLGAAIAAWVAALQREIHTSAVKSSVPRTTLLLRRTSGLGAPALVVLAGASLLVESGGGLYWWAPAILLAYLGALADAWVLLVEVLR